MANQSGYSSAQIMSMQRDAERRVNEMRRIAQNRLRQTEVVLHPAPEPVNRPPAPNPVAAEPPLPVLPEANGGLTGILDRLGLDEETLLILILLLLLVNEGADSMLVLALVYVLL